jgi:DNA-binding IclR family transcriptional regulator
MAILLKGYRRALDVLECFRDNETSLNLTDISRLVGLPESSLFRILSTLESRGYLLRTQTGLTAWLPSLFWD